MANKPRQSLTYFPLEVVFDEKIKLLEAEFGLEGFAAIIKLFQHIYGGEGYYCNWTDELQLLFASSELKLVGGSDFIQKLTKAAINRGLFNSEIFEKYQILTSKGIQERYFLAVTRRKKIEVNENILLVKVNLFSQNDNKNGINDDINAENVRDNATNKIKENKREKETEIKEKLKKTNKVKIQGDFYDDLISKFNKRLNPFGLSKSDKLFEKVKKNIDKTFEDFTIEQYDQVLDIISKSEFLKGETKNPFKASFDWIFRENNFYRILNYCYNAKSEKQESESSYDIDFLDEYWNTVPTLNNNEDNLND